MPVTVRPSSHSAKAVFPYSAATSAETLLRESCYEKFKRCKGVLRSSFEGNFAAWADSDAILPATNGFVHAAHAAYSQHHHLTIRPEHVWFSILSQFSFYVNAHAKELRTRFVRHQGRKEIEVRSSTTFEDLVTKMTNEMEKHFVDPDLREWILPNFSTTKETDIYTAAILMMGTLREYSAYRMRTSCGIPSVTLLGQRDDWVKLEKRLEKLATFGDETQQFAALLAPVLGYFTRSFDEPEGPAVISFWSRIAHKSAGSGVHYLSGWITAFCFWNTKGRCLYSPPTAQVNPSSHEPKAAGDEENQDRGEGVAKEDPEEDSPPSAGCDLDGTLFHQIDFHEIPPSYGSVSAKVVEDENQGQVHHITMVAGNVGIQAWASHDDDGQAPSEERAGLVDSIQPLSGWWVYENKDQFGYFGPNGRFFPL